MRAARRPGRIIQRVGRCMHLNSTQHSSDRPTIIVMISIFRACDFHVALSSNEHISLCAQRAARDALFYTKCERASVAVYKIWPRSISLALDVRCAVCFSFFLLGRNLLRKKASPACYFHDGFILCVREMSLMN